jgi:Mor family transcriptional regulator
MNKKWYIVENVADECEVTIVELTDEEAKTVRKFLDTQEVVVPADYKGTTSFFLNKPYNTKEEAINAVNTCDYYH